MGGRAALPAGLSCAASSMKTCSLGKPCEGRREIAAPLCRNHAALPSCSQPVFGKCQIFVRSQGKHTDLMSIDVLILFGV